jgi:polysaccharide biosynthesis/export protein
MARFTLSFVLLCAIASMMSCGSVRELQYLQGDIDTAKFQNYEIPETKIQEGDLLNIIVFSDNSEATIPFNLAAGNAHSGVTGVLQEASTPSPVAGPGYLVDSKGTINFPVVGTLHVGGLTKLQLTSLLTERLKPYLSNPYYSIRFMNFKVTVIGEVTKPGMYTIPAERVNVLEAIGLAGDLTYFGKRENVLVMRETNGKRQFGRINLQDPNLFQSPYYFLQQNDVVLVDMSKRKVAANDQIAFRNISLAATVVSAVALLVSVLRN